MTTPPATLPRWDMTVVYPSLESPEFIAGFAAVQAAVNSLRDLFDAEKIDLQPHHAVDAARIAIFEHVTPQFNAVLGEFETLGAYITAFITTDSRDAVAQARLSELQLTQSTLAQLDTRFTAWLGSMDVEALITQSQLAADHAYTLRKAKIQATHLMSPAEEALAAELGLTGGSAWEKLYDTVVSQISVSVEIDGQMQESPMSKVRNMAFSPDRAVRKRGYEAELQAWEHHAEPLAAALNSIKGQVNTLSKKRGWDSALDAAIFGASIDRATLEAMMGAARESFGDFRRYLHIKAQALGIPKMAFYDIFAPVGGGDRTWDFATAESFILEHFGSFSEKMRTYAQRAFRERWIDAEPRAGKRGGAFCMSLRADESRILTNFDPSYEGVSTLAHELGHGYHNINLAHRTALQRATPMTLAETASIFCETLAREAALKNASRAEQLEILEASIQGSCQVVVDITSRFLFESRVFEQRQQRELSVAELCEIMLAAQRETYGDGLDDTQLHPYMWAAKGHYYSPDLSFYNFPYMFGLLFGLGLFARYQHDAETFKRGYDALLASTGMADAATLAAQFAIDLHSPAFWRGSFDVLRADINRFEQLVNGA